MQSMQSLMMHHDKNNPYLAGGVQGVPPSILGFVCKPDMPPHIIILFRARQPLEFNELPDKGKCRPYEGLLGINKEILTKFDTKPPEKYIPDESKRISRLKSIVEKVEQHKMENLEKLKEWNPKNDPNAIGDPYKTLFIYRLDHRTDEKRLKREFEMYGPIKRVRVVRDSEGKSRGYGFIEFEHKSDFKNAYKRGDRKRVDEARVSVDYERGRTEKNWKPRRLGGGRGDTRVYPYWLEKQIMEIKDLYPEIVAKYKKEEKSEQKRSRTRSRDYSQQSRKKGTTEESKQETVKKENEVENGNAETPKKSYEADNFPMTNIKQEPKLGEEHFTDINAASGMDIEEETVVKGDSHNEDQKPRNKHKEKKEKKEKKTEKRSKKDKKEKREKRENHGKNSNEWEAGEIRSD